MENVGTDLATLQTAVAGNLFELGRLLRLPAAGH